MRLAMLPAGLLAAGAAFATLAPSGPAAAQALSSGDYARCTVHDREGRNRGLDSVCLSRKRAQLAWLQERQSRFSPPVTYNPGSAPCPLYANGGRGFATTVTGHGGFPGYAAAYDSPSNGRPCLPQLNIRLPGVP